MVNEYPERSHLHPLGGVHNAAVVLSHERGTEKGKKKTYALSPSLSYLHN